MSTVLNIYFLLTSDHLVVEGVAGLNGINITPAKETPTDTIQVLATCHSLAQLEDELVGDPLEKATLKALDWTVTKGDAVISRKSKMHGLKIFHRFHFASSLKRMSVIAGHTAPGAANTDYIGKYHLLFISLGNLYFNSILELKPEGADIVSNGVFLSIIPRNLIFGIYMYFGSTKNIFLFIWPAILEKNCQIHTRALSHT